MPNTEWSVAGLCVTARPENLDEVEARLRECPDVEVHARDDRGGRLVVVQEHATVTDHRKGLEMIQALPGVLTAELVALYREAGRSHDERPTGGQS
jgi:nitrate reductase NapAB chaperone NapD